MADAHINATNFLVQALMAVSCGMLVIKNRLVPGWGSPLLLLIACLLVVLEMNAQAQDKKQAAASPPVSVIQMVRENDVKALSKLLDSSPDAFAEKDKAGFSAAHAAAILNSTACLDLLAKRAPYLLTNQANGGITVAYLAAQFNNTECLEIVATQAKATLGTKRQGDMLPSHAAAFNDGLECLRLLAREAPETLSDKDGQGNTPAHAAIEGGSTKALWFLRETAPRSFEIKNNDGLTPVELAQKRGKKDCARVCIGEKPSDEDLGIPKRTDCLAVTAPATVVRTVGKWISTKLPESPSTTIVSRYDVSVSPLGKLWEMPIDGNPRTRLMFFTSAKNPLKDLAQLKSAALEGEFVCWDANVTALCFNFLAIAGIAPPYAERGNFQIKLRGDGFFEELFQPDSKVKLLVTYSSFETALRKNGAVPVYFVERPSAVQK